MMSSDAKEESGGPPFSGDEKHVGTHSLEYLPFHNSVLEELPVDKETRNFVRSVRGAYLSRVRPTPVKNPRLVSFSKSALALIDLAEKEVERKEFVEYFSGNKMMHGAEYYALCYCGHQFGSFAGQLGDGRAIAMGEVVNGKGERWELQLKGSGMTPFSRTADGRAVVRSSVREFLCSEALYYLGIPTTRAGALITSDTKVMRDIRYSGNPIYESCAICLRIAPTFFRFGSFEIFKKTDPQTGREGPSVGLEDPMLFQLLDYIIKYHYPDIWNSNATPEEKYLQYYTDVVRKTALMVAEWQSVGFVHGVLNTDNMSVLGLTIDYGPFGFMDAYNPNFISNGSDDAGRYSYKNQPSICHWNLHKLGEAIQKALPLSKSEPALAEYYTLYEEYFYDKMRKKFGLVKELPEDKDLIQAFFDVLADTGGDFTNCFRCLAKAEIPSQKIEKLEQEPVLDYILTQVSSPEKLAKMQAPSLAPKELQMLMTLAQTHPEVLGMMGRSPEFLAEEVEKLERFEKLKKQTCKEKDAIDTAKWSQWLMDYKNRLTIEIEGKSEEKVHQFQSERIATMNANNPVIVLRNWIAQSIIEKTEKGEYDAINTMLERLKHPFDDVPGFEEYQKETPSWAEDLCVTCSS